MTATSTETIAAAVAPLEKTPLETYVAPAKPSLIGMSRAELAERLLHQADRILERRFR